MSSKVTIYTHGSQELSAQLVEALGDGDKKFHIDSRTISSLVVEEDKNAIKLLFSDGTSATESFLVHNPFTQVKGPFAEQLGIEVTPSPIPGLEIGDIAVSPPTYQTNVRGAFAAGDCITPYKVVPGAISSGCNAAVAASSQLLAEKYGHHPMF